MNATSRGALLALEDSFTQPLPRYWTARLDLTF